MTAAWCLLAVMMLADPGGEGPVTEVAERRLETVDGGAAAGPAALQAAVKGGDYLKVACERVDFDRGEGVVMLDGGASVDYGGEYFMNSERMFVLFDGTNRFDRIIAIGEVTLTNLTRSGSCTDAVFRRKSGEIEMHGGEENPAVLREGAGQEVRGRTIRFWTDTEQVEIDGSEITFGSGAGVLFDDKKRGENKR